MKPTDFVRRAARAIRLVERDRRTVATTSQSTLIIALLSTAGELRGICIRRCHNFKSCIVGQSQSHRSWRLGSILQCESRRTFTSITTEWHMQPTNVAVKLCLSRLVSHYGAFETLFFSSGKPAVDMFGVRCCRGAVNPASTASVDRLGSNMPGSTYMYVRPFAAMHFL